VYIELLQFGQIRQAQVVGFGERFKKGNVELAEHLGGARLGNLLEVIADRRIHLGGKGNQ
jgi:hypothetical protein